ncbi:glycosyltransferase [Occultella kanbiaonis]|uniref:glycosyltransferase n=1 Tax=Occultella kanbiaonis TaxID=2675754 RepID=UPI0013D2A47C|nr:glycosyltransferase [Occultella kanbiaonis]
MPTSDLPFVSVIVPVRDDPRLSACLSQLTRQTYPTSRFEIIVADNGSREPVAAREDVQIIQVPSPGSYSARNAAVEQSRGTILAFTDSDCLPADDWLAESVAGIAAGAGVVAGHVHVYARDARRPSPIEAYELVHAFPQERYVARRGACVTANMTTTREAFDAVGGFKSELLSGADIEWSQRANAAGYLTTFRASAVVRHPARQTFAAMSGKLRRVIAGRYERDALEGNSALAPWPRPRSVLPPLGAFRRAAEAGELRTVRARASFIVGEFYHRYASVWIATELAWRDRRSRRAS